MQGNSGGMQLGRENADESDFVDSFFLPGGILDPDDATAPVEVSTSLTTPLRQTGESPSSGLYGLSTVPAVASYSPWGSAIVAGGPSPLRNVTGSHLQLIHATTPPAPIQGSPLISDVVASTLNAESSNFVPGSARQSWIPSTSSSPSLPPSPTLLRSSPVLLPPVPRGHGPVVAPPGFESSLVRRTNEWIAVAATSDLNGNLADMNLSFQGGVDRKVETRTPAEVQPETRLHQSSPKSLNVTQVKETYCIPEYVKPVSEIRENNSSLKGKVKHLKEPNKSKTTEGESRTTKNTTRKSPNAIGREISSKPNSSLQFVPESRNKNSKVIKEEPSNPPTKAYQVTNKTLVEVIKSSTSNVISKDKKKTMDVAFVEPVQEDTKASSPENIALNNFDQTPSSIKVEDNMVVERVTQFQNDPEIKTLGTANSVPEKLETREKEVPAEIPIREKDNLSNDAIGLNTSDKVFTPVDASNATAAYDVDVINERQSHANQRLQVEQGDPFVMFTEIGRYIQSLSNVLSFWYLDGFVPLCQQVLSFWVTTTTILFQSCIILVLGVASIFSFAADETNIFNFAADDATSHVVLGIFWGSPSVLCYYVFCLMPVLCNLLMTHVGNLPHFTPHLLSNLAVYYVCRLLSHVSTDPSPNRRKSSKKLFSFSTSVGNNTASYNHSLSQQQNSDRFGNEVCQSILRLVAMALPIVFFVEGFSQSNSSFMLYTAHKRMILAYVLSLFKRGLILSPVAWIGWSVQVLLAAYVPAGSVLNAIQFFLGLAFIRLVTLVQLEGQSVPIKTK